MKKYVTVAVVGLCLKPLTYYCLEEIALGELVLVYVRDRKRLGVVLAITSEKPDIKGIKPVTKLANKIIIAEPYLKLAKWLSDYYITPIAEVFGMMLPTECITDQPVSDKNITVSNLGKQALAKKASPAQKKLLAYVLNNNVINSFISCNDAGFSNATINACWTREWLIEQKQDAAITNVELNTEQKTVVADILAQDQFKVFLLDAATGSGKTEVYCEVIKQKLSDKRQALVLVPEIGLTKQTVHRFVSRCGVQAAVIHSKISARYKAARWHSANNGDSNLVIGTRSALFVPLHKLGIIIIDEGHDASFKQQNTCCYSARHAAIMLAKMLNIPIVLGSATPSVESLYNAQIGLYHHLRMKSFKPHKPVVELIDLRNKVTEYGVSLLIKDKISNALASSEQVLVFLNRRGFAPVLLCHTCGYSKQCASCEANFVVHKETNELKCHHCNKNEAIPARCPECGAKSWLQPGLGTQKVEQLLINWFPKHSIIRIDKDNTNTSSKFDVALGMINSNKADIIIGTQMLAKGHDFANIGLVVILDCDSQLYSPDFRSHERLAQLLVQVAGRVGRRGQAGRICLQTHQPQHEIFSVLRQGYHAWVTKELQLRLKYNLEPFIYSMQIHIQAQKLSALDNIKANFINKVAVVAGVKLIGPIANVRPKRQGFWRYVVILESNTRSALNKQAVLIKETCNVEGWHNIAKWRYDPDPQEY